MNGFSALTKIGWLEPYFTIGMYVTLRKPEERAAIAA
jgi:hypothetical protein